MPRFQTVLFQVLAVSAFLSLLVPAAFAEGYRRDSRYAVTITNITKGQTFTPMLLTTHASSVGLFEVGAPASEALGILAEGGDTAPLTGELESLGRRKVGEVVTALGPIGPGLLGPGQSVTAEITANSRTSRLSAAAMLIPTNDTFFGLDSVRLPRWGSRTFFAKAYDAGTEENDQNCANIPGPRCGGEGASPEPAEGDEGYIALSNGFIPLIVSTFSHSSIRHDYPSSFLIVPIYLLANLGPLNHPMVNSFDWLLSLHLPMK